MNFTPIFGWYYKNANDKSPSWTGVPYFYDFLTRQNQGIGPFGVETGPDGVLPGDFVQLEPTGEDGFGHMVIVVERGEGEGILVASHSRDADYRPLSSYLYSGIRFIHVLGVRIPR